VDVKCGACQKVRSGFFLLCLSVSCISRCSCDECNIVRMVASGIVSPELTEQLSHSGAGSLQAPSYCFTDVLPQMITAGAGDQYLHNQLPMMFAPLTE